ncbi:MAG: SGNH/GDSL hydrolase family protein [Alicyclobacillaceae bacterium]|nr:SGNH/GDSL hydrolase family protein [Alicyclobacillaceae bacterium]
MLYAALGDSITYGYCATSPERRYVARMQRALRQPTSLFVQARPGWTSRQLLRTLRRVPECIWDEAKLVTILIGGNDLLVSAPWLLEGHPGRTFKVAERLYVHLTDIIRYVRRPQSTVIVGTLYNPFPNSLLAKECFHVVNETIRLAAQRERVAVADVAARFANREADLIDGYRRGTLRDLRLIGNPIHPNDAGHEVIASTMLAAYRQAAGAPRTERARMRPAAKRLVRSAT